MTDRGLFVGIGVSAYDEHDPLPEATRELSELVGLVSETLSGEPLLDPATAQVWAHLEALQEQPHNGTLVLYWSGHAVVTASGGFRLMTRDSKNQPRSGIPAKEVILQSLHGDLSQVLIIVDTCFSGAATELNAQVAAEILQESQDAAKVWVGVLASCQSFETARDGVFGRHLIDVVRHGPSDPALRRAWSVHNRWLKGDDLGNALLAEWGEGQGQRPVFRREGLSGPVIPNPQHQEAARPQVVEHLLLAARGGDGDRSWFTGRREEVDTVVEWIGSDQPGVRVVTGSAGTGKSAITGRVVSAAAPGERDRLLEQGEFEHLDPGAGAVDAHAHLRGLTPDQVAETLDRQLVARGVLKVGARKRTALQLVTALERAQPDELPVLVLDGLDEARDHAFAIARDLLTGLGRTAIVVVSTRERAAEDTAEHTAHEPRASTSHASVGVDTLVESLHPIAVLDLDEPRSLESGRLARFDYVRRRLSARRVAAGDGVVMDPHAVALFLVEEAATDEPFLVARLLVDQLLAHPIDTREAGWRDRARTSIDAALQDALDALPAPTHRTLPADMTAAAFGRAVLAALTWGLGAGFPEAEWAAVATGLVADACRCPDAELEPVDARDITWVLSHLGRFVVEDGESGVAVYRVAHQSLADHLRSPFHPTREQPFDPAAAPVSAALTERYGDLLAAAVAADAPPYLYRYAWYHAGSAGPDGIAQLSRLAGIDPALTYDVGLTAELVAGLLTDQERYDEAATCYETAVQHLSELDLTVTAHAHHLGDSLAGLGRCRWTLEDPEGALVACQRSTKIFRDLAERDPAYGQYAATAAFNMSIYFHALGRLEESVAAAIEAAFRYREVARTDDAVAGDWADALEQLASRLGAVGLPDQALALKRAFATALQDVAIADPQRRVELGRVAFELGTWEPPLPRDEAVMWLSGSVSLYRELDAEGADSRYELAQSLHFLAPQLAEDDMDTAIGAATEATSLLAELVPDHPESIPAPLCLAAIQLAELCNTQERHGDAVDAARHAIETHRGLDAETAAEIDIAPTLRILTLSLAELDRLDEACAVAEELAAALSETAADRQARERLGLTYASQARWLHGLGRHEEAAARAQQAIDVLVEILDEDDEGLLYDIVSAWRIVAAAPAPSVSEQPGEDSWQRAVGSLDDRAGAALRSIRALDEPDDTVAVELLAHAMPTFELDATMTRAQTLRVHEETRRRVAAAPDTAAAWSAVTGGPLPVWATVDPGSLETARLWAFAETHRDERQVLRSHPEILRDDYDVAVDEALLSINPAVWEPLRNLREQARQLGADEAYRAVVAAEVAHQLTIAGLADLRGLLCDDVADLGLVRDALVGADDVDLSREAALVDLAQTPEGSSMIARLSEAVERSGAIEELMWSLAESDVPSMQAAAETLVNVSGPGANRAIGLMFRAIARLLADNTAQHWPLPAQVAADIQEALQDFPELPSYWVGDLTDRVGTLPRLVGPIAALSGLLT